MHHYALIIINSLTHLHSGGDDALEVLLHAPHVDLALVLGVQGLWRKDTGGISTNMGSGFTLTLNPITLLWYSASRACGWKDTGGG